MRIVSFVGMAVGVVLGSRAQYVWTNCGYDCGIFSVASGPAAVFALLIALVVLVLSSVLYAVCIYRSKRAKKTAKTIR